MDVPASGVVLLTAVMSLFKSYFHAQPPSNPGWLHWVDALTPCGGALVKVCSKIRLYPAGSCGCPPDETTAATTESRPCPVTPSTAAMMDATPTLSSVATPLELTAATVGLLLDQ